MSEPRQIIVARKDLKMPPGKLGAQVAHASMGAFLKSMSSFNDGSMFSLHLDSPVDSPLSKWLEGRFTKIVVQVKSEEALLNVYKKAEEAGIPCAIIKDAGLTVFNEPTLTCVGIGPVFPEDLIGITDKLQLYKE